MCLLGDMGTAQTSSGKRGSALEGYLHFPDGRSRPSHGKGADLGEEHPGKTLKRR